MSVPPSLENEIDEFFMAFADALIRHDADYLADQYAYPSHITSDVGKITLTPVLSKREWKRAIEEQLFSYRRIGFSSLVRLGLKIVELSPLLTQVCVHWALNDFDDKLLYDYEVTYTLGRFDGRRLITCVVIHDEMPPYRAETLAGGFFPETSL